MFKDVAGGTSEKCARNPVKGVAELQLYLQVAIAGAFRHNDSFRDIAVAIVRAAAKEGIAPDALAEAIKLEKLAKNNC